MRLLFTALACLLSVSFYAQDLIESHLPIVVIEYENDVDEIPDEPRVLRLLWESLTMVKERLIILTIHTNEYSGNIGIETRGNSTQLYEKKTYTIELWDESKKINLYLF